ncbi:MAG: ABC transporter substrate-binding protein [Candidatus Methanomethylicaceae archaeon]
MAHSRLTRGLSLLMVVFLLAACVMPTPTPVKETVAVEETLIAEEAAPTPTEAAVIEVGPDGMIVPHPLFTDSSGQCTKNVKLTMQTHGDYTDKSVDARYAVGLLLKRWDEGQPCVTLELVPVPPGDAPAFANSQFIAGSPTDIVNTWPYNEWYDNKWVIQFDDYLAKKNPYSPNDTWYEDFPYAELVMQPYSDGHYYYIRVGIRIGESAPDAIIYNANLLQDVGVDLEKEIPPKSMSELFAILKKVKDAGKVGFWFSLAGDTRWEAYWYSAFLMDQLMPDVIAEMDKAIDENDDRWGTVSEIEFTYAALKGIWKATDPRVGEYFRIIKEWSQYWQPGYASPTELVAEVPVEFLKGNVAMATFARWRISTLENYPNLGFEWGTFALPPLDRGITEYATGQPSPRAGAGEPASSEFVPLFIASRVQKDPDKLAAAIDLFQYMTAPKSSEFWCEQLLFPCYTPGASLEAIFKGDKVKMQHLRGFVEPRPILPSRGAHGPLFLTRGGYDEVIRLMTEYLQGNITLEALQNQLQELIMAGAQDKCRDKLNNQVKGWEWCAEFVKQ